MRRHKPHPPASEAEIARRIKHVLSFLPLSRDELHDQVVLHVEDEETFTAALKEAKLAGAVVRDERRREWLQLPIQVTPKHVPATPRRRIRREERRNQ